VLNPSVTRKTAEADGAVIWYQADLLRCRADLVDAKNDLLSSTRAAAVNSSALFHHFKSKEDLSFVVIIFNKNAEA
jgi:hypothetical protein